MEAQQLSDHVSQCYLYTRLARPPSEDLGLWGDIWTTTAKLEGSNRVFTTRDHEVASLETPNSIEGQAEV